MGVRCRTGRAWAVLRRDGAADEGFGLVEAVVAALVLMLFSGAVFGMIGTTLKVSKVDRQRVAASNLASREMEITRNSLRGGDAAVLALVGAGTVTDPDPTGPAGPSVVDGVPYTVTRTVTWLPTGTGTSACDGGSTVTYPAVHVNVVVTWPDIGSVRPVTSDSIVTPNKTLLNTSLSYVAVKVVTYAGTPSASRPVSVSGPSGSWTVQTDDAGCAVFGLSSTGSHSFSLTEGGYVDFASNTPASQSVSVTSGSFKQVSFTWDRSVALNVALAAPAGYALPAALPSVTAYNASLPSTGTPPNTRTVPATSAGSTVVTGLGPYTNGYSVWAGGCADADPAGSPTSGQSTNVVAAPGQTVPATVTLGALMVTGPPNVTVVATSVDGNCATAADKTITLGMTDVNGQLLTSLPYGQWTVASPGGAASEVFHPTQPPYDSVNNPVASVVVP